MDPRDSAHQPLLHQRSLLLESQEKKRQFEHLFLTNWLLSFIGFSIRNIFSWISFCRKISLILIKKKEAQTSNPHNKMKCFRCSDEFTSIFSSVEHHQSRLAQGIFKVIWIQPFWALSRAKKPSEIKLMDQKDVKIFF